MLLLAREQQIQRFSQQHDRDTTQGYKHKDTLDVSLALEHELLAAWLRFRLGEQHHVDEQNQHGGRATLSVRLVCQMYLFISITSVEHIRHIIDC